MERSRAVNARLRRLPPVDVVVQAAGSAAGSERDLPRWCLLAAARAVLDEARDALLRDASAEPPDAATLAARARREAAQLFRPWPRRVINATGIVLHTNLGRAPLAEAAAEEVRRAASGYSDLELDLASGRRGSRNTRVARLLRLLSGAEDAHVVNNTAAALLLTVDALAAGREVVVSRGELVEIGGSFRVPDIMSSSRARLREIGTTNRTHPSDYRDAIGEQTGILLKVHRSNFSIEGFTSEVALEPLAEIAREAGLPLVEDRGSGSFVDLQPYGLPEPPAWQGLREGADLVLFSGDKLLGGPQAGIILGRADLVARLRSHPMARALRVDKMTLAALDWTLRALLDGRESEIPVLRMLLEPVEAITARAERLAAALRASGREDVTVERVAGVVGGGALPDLELPTVVVRLAPMGRKGRLANDLARDLRMAEPALLARVHRDALQLDCRTLHDDEIGVVAKLVADLSD